MSDTTTLGVRVKVKPAYWPERSAPKSQQYAFMYDVEIINEGAVPVQLRTRHWIITDASGNVEEVRGEGVVGKQPRLQPGERFRYQSWAVLKTSFGTMQGSFRMVDDQGAAFDARIGEFALMQPNTLH